MENVIKKVNIIFLIAIILLLLLNVFSYLTNDSITIDATSENQVKKIKLIIDPGHGGVDQGASGNLDTLEAPINLEISLKLMKFLEASGYEVEMTRYDDIGLYDEDSDTIRKKKNADIKNRVNAINNSNADLAVLIHLNAFTEQKYYGAHVFYKEKSDNSKTAAFIIQESLKEILDKENKRVPQAKKNVKIIDNSEIPTVLIECGFLSNEEEEKKLITPEYQEKIAWAIFSGLMNYFNQP